MHSGEEQSSRRKKTLTINTLRSQRANDYNDDVVIIVHKHTVVV